MKRSWDLIREILAAFEADRFVDFLNRADLTPAEMAEITDNHRREADPDEVQAMQARKRRVIWLHVELLTDSGLLSASEYDSATGNNGRRITMSGYDMLEALRDQNLWERIKRQAVKGGVKVTWAFINAALPALMAKVAGV